MNFTNVLVLLGGVALFLYGMSLMGDGLKKVAGNKLEMILYRLSSTPLKGILLGTAVTGVIQSSAATSVMVVGFVNSSLMQLHQAIGVIMGSIIGTSVTGWIVFLSTVGGSASGIVSLFSTEVLSAVIAVVGIVFRLFSKRQSRQHVGDILLVFAILMFGMKTMSGSVSGLKESPAFIGLMTNFSNPFLGLLIGIACTAVLQSSSAAVGILQALSVTGVIPFRTALPIIMGIAIGASVPVLVSAIGASSNGRRTAYSYLFITTAGSILFGGIFYILNAFLHFSFMDTIMNSFNIALFNSFFRFVIILALIPFMNLLEKSVKSLIKRKPNEFDESEDFSKLDERLISYPALAVEQCRIVIDSMEKKTKESMDCAIALLNAYNDKEFSKVKKLEDLTDKYEDRISRYLMRITTGSLTDAQAKSIGKYLHTVTDFERISDHAINIAESAREGHEKKVRFTDQGKREIVILTHAVSEIVDLAFHAFSDNDLEACFKVEPLESVIDNLCDELKTHHVDRLQQGICSLQNGYIFNDLITNFERVSDHCSNIALAVIEQDSDDFDPHAYISSLQEVRENGFDQFYADYKAKYSVD